MTINGISGTGGSNDTQQMQFGKNMQMDSVSKSIQKQIEKAQKQLQELSSNKELSLEDKMKKRQEIQQTITTLNQELRQHQIELRKEQTGKVSEDDSVLGKDQQTKTKDSKETGLSQASMKSMLSADASIKQAKVQGKVATQMNGRAGILESEIKLDGSRGQNTEKKEEQLAEIKAKAQAATTEQLSNLGDAMKTMSEVSDEEEVDKTENAESTETAESATDKAGQESDRMESKENPYYTPVDVRL